MTHASIPRSPLPAIPDLRAVAPLPDPDAEHLAAIASTGRSAPATNGAPPSYDHSGFSARQRLIESFLPLVGHLARRYPHYRLWCVTRPDLTQVGALALITAIDSYTPGSSLFFTVYHAVKHALWEEIARSNRIYRIPRKREGQIQRIRAAQSAVLTCHGRLPAIAELVDCTGYSAATIQLLLSTSTEAVSLNQPLGETEAPLITTIAGCDDTAAQALHNCQIADLAAALRALPERQRRVLVLYYGLGPYPPASLVEIAHTLRLTHRQASHALQCGLGTLRQALGASEECRSDLVCITSTALNLRTRYAALGRPPYVQLHRPDPHTLQVSASAQPGRRVHSGHFIRLTKTLCHQFRLRPGYYQADTTESAVLIDTSRSLQLYAADQA
jgi:RNA polymerase primary sigma factor